MKHIIFKVEPPNTKPLIIFSVNSWSGLINVIGEQTPNPDKTVIKPISFIQLLAFLFDQLVEGNI